MIFATIGSTHNNFTRLLGELDRLSAEGKIKGLLAQTGSAGYTPRHYDYVKFLSSREYEEYIRQAEFIICHAGDGTLNQCLAQRKKIIVVPRRMEFGEHPDNHQLELAAHLGQKGRVLPVLDIKELEDRLQEVEHWSPRFNENPDNSGMLKAVAEFINLHLE